MGSNPTIYQNGRLTLNSFGDPSWFDVRRVVKSKLTHFLIQYSDYPLEVRSDTWSMHVHPELHIPASSILPSTGTGGLAYGRSGAKPDPVESNQ